MSIVMQVAVGHHGANRVDERINDGEKWRNV